MRLGRLIEVRLLLNPPFRCCPSAKRFADRAWVETPSALFFPRQAACRAHQGGAESFPVISIAIERRAW